MTKKQIHEAMIAGMDPEEIIAAATRRTRDWVRDVVDEILDRVQGWERAIETQWRMAMAECEERSAEPKRNPEQSYSSMTLSVGGWPAAVSMGLETGESLSREQRALFSEVAHKHEFDWALFGRMYGGDYQHELLKMASPMAGETP